MAKKFWMSTLKMFVRETYFIDTPLRDYEHMFKDYLTGLI